MKDCNSCGKCCIKYGNGGLSASQSDLQLWESLRPDIFEYVKDGNIWVHPDSGKQIDLCPWLRKESDATAYTCAIYFDRPEDCRVYPTTIKEMIVDECEMLEAQDMYNLKEAQAELDLKYRD